MSIPVASNSPRDLVWLRRERILDQRLRGDRIDRLQNPTRDAVGISHRVRPAILEIAAVAALDETVRDADRRAAIGDAVRELVDCRGLVQAGRAKVVLGAVAGVGRGARIRKCARRRCEVLLPADLAHVLRREVRVQTRAVPVDVGAQRLRMEVDINAVPLAEPEHQVTRDPELVSGARGALAEDLEFPLSLRDFGVDALDRDARCDAEVDVLVDDLPCDVADDLRLAAQVRNGLVTVEPDVLELELHRLPPPSWTNKKGPGLRES